MCTFTSSPSSDTIGGMGKAGKALKQVLEQYKISQNKLAITLGVQRYVVYRWFHEQVDPSGETIAEITQALKQINSDAAQEFIQLYLGNLLDNPEKLEDE
jgi:transcriptional regulator with XRE-family HTH domain